MASIFDQTDKTEISIPTLKQLGWTIETHVWTNWITGKKKIDLFITDSDWGSRYKAAHLDLEYHFNSPCSGYLLIRCVPRKFVFASDMDRQRQLDRIFDTIEDKFLEYQIDSLEEMSSILKMVEVKYLNYNLYFTKD